MHKIFDHFHFAIPNPSAYQINRHELMNLISVKKKKNIKAVIKDVVSNINHFNKAQHKLAELFNIIIDK